MEKKTAVILHKWDLVAWDKFPVTALCMIQKCCISNNLYRSKSDMPHKTALENSKSGFSDDEDTMSNECEEHGKNESKKKTMSVNSHFCVSCDFKHLHLN